MYLFWERERERSSGGGAERERERERNSQAGSALSAQSLTHGLNSQTVRSWPEPKARVRRLTNWATQVPHFLQVSFGSLECFCVSVSVKYPESLSLIFLHKGHLGGSVGGASNFSSGHHLVVCGFQPRIRLCADSLESGACFRFCVSPLSLSLPCWHSVSLCLSIINKRKKN